MSKRHLVIGDGNLGRAIFNHLTEQGEDASLLSREECDMRTNSPKLSGYEYVWYTVGSGSVAEAAKDARGAFQLHLVAPVHLAQQIAEHQLPAKLIVFSSDYAEQPKLSLYAQSKHFMEVALQAFECVHCYRISSLYGAHKPMNTFVGKLLKRVLNGEEIAFSCNEVAPSPVEWVAEMAWQLVQRGRKNAYILPEGRPLAAEWGAMVLSTLVKMNPDIFKSWQPRILEKKFFDESRPEGIMGVSKNLPGEGLGINGVSYLWDKHGPACIQAALDEVTK